MEFLGGLRHAPGGFLAVLLFLSFLVDMEFHRHSRFPRHGLRSSFRFSGFRLFPLDAFAKSRSTGRTPGRCFFFGFRAFRVLLGLPAPYRRAHLDPLDLLVPGKKSQLSQKGLPRSLGPVPQPSDPGGLSYLCFLYGVGAGPLVHFPKTEKIGLVLVLDRLRNGIRTDSPSMVALRGILDLLRPRRLGRSLSL